MYGGVLAGTATWKHVCFHSRLAVNLETADFFCVPTRCTEGSVEGYQILEVVGCVVLEVVPAW